MKYRAEKEIFIAGRLCQPGEIVDIITKIESEYLVRINKKGEVIEKTPEDLPPLNATDGALAE